MRDSGRGLLVRSSGRKPAPCQVNPLCLRIWSSYGGDFKSSERRSPSVHVFRRRCGQRLPSYDASKDFIFDFLPEGSAAAIPDPWKARLDVMLLATESGKRADF